MITYIVALSSETVARCLSRDDGLFFLRWWCLKDARGLRMPYWWFSLLFYQGELRFFGERSLQSARVLERVLPLEHVAMLFREIASSSEGGSFLCDGRRCPDITLRSKRSLQSARWKALWLRAVMLRSKRSLQSARWKALWLLWTFTS